MRGFLVVWIGQVAALVGSALAAFALGVHVYTVTGSVSAFTLFEFLALMPAVVLSPIAGALIDRWSAARALAAADLIASVLPFALIAMLAAAPRALAPIAVSVVASSVLAAFQWPALAALTARLVAPAELGRAAGMTELARGIAQIFAPVLAGLAMTHDALRWVLAADGVCHAVSAAILLARPRALAAVWNAPLAKAASASVTALFEEVRAAIRYLRARRDLLLLAGFVAATNLALGSVEICITPLVLSVASPAALGAILWVGGIGMLLGGVVMSVWTRQRRPMRAVVAGTLVQGVLLIVAGAQRSLVALAVITFLYLFCTPIVMASNQALWLRAIPHELQGRVLGFRRALESAALPAGILLAGPLVALVCEPLATRPLFARVVGGGPGRGIALMYVLLGVATVLTALAAIYVMRGERFAASTAGDADPGDAGEKR